jgi:hypothetical protein
VILFHKVASHLVLLLQSFSFVNMEKLNTSDYKRLATHDQSSQLSETADLLYDQIPARRQRSIQYKLRIGYAIVFIAYSMLLLYIPTRFLSTAQTQTSMYCMLHHNLHIDRNLPKSPKTQRRSKTMFASSLPRTSIPRTLQPAASSPNPATTSTPNGASSCKVLPYSRMK